MPLYNYKCESCENEFELLRKMSDMELALNEPCPSCEKEGEITQQITASNFADPISMGHKRPDSGFNEVLSKIKQAHPAGNWDNKKFNPTRQI